MFFGRRKHAAPAPAAVPASTLAAAVPAAPVLTDELIFAAVQRTLGEVFGEGGDWTVTRRAPEQDDTIFHDVLVHSLATSVTASVAAARESLAPTGGPLGLLRVPRPEPAPVAVSTAVAGDEDSAAELAEGAGAEVGPEIEEPAALSWEPAPITRWADLKRPVTGEIAIADRDKAA